MESNDNNIAGGCFFAERQLNKTHMKQCMGVLSSALLVIQPQGAHL